MRFYSTVFLPAICGPFEHVATLVTCGLASRLFSISIVCFRTVYGAALSESRHDATAARGHFKILRPKSGRCSDRTLAGCVPDAIAGRGIET
jgi:hypothetical protein